MRLNSRSWAARQDLSAKGNFPSKIGWGGVLRTALLGCRGAPVSCGVKQSHFWPTLWWGRGCSTGLQSRAGGCKSGLNHPSPITSPRALPALHRNGTQTRSLLCTCPSCCQGQGLGLFCLPKDQVHFDLNKQQLKILQKPSSKPSASSLTLFSVFAFLTVYFSYLSSVFSAYLNTS